MQALGGGRAFVVIHLVDTRQHQKQHHVQLRDPVLQAPGCLATGRPVKPYLVAQGNRVLKFLSSGHEFLSLYNKPQPVLRLLRPTICDTHLDLEPTCFTLALLRKIRPKLFYALQCSTKSNRMMENFGVVEVLKTGLDSAPTGTVPTLSPSALASPVPGLNQPTELNDEHKVYWIAIVIGLLGALGTISVIGRLYYRRKTGAFGLDDYVLLAALVSSLSSPPRDISNS